MKHLLLSLSVLAMLVSCGKDNSVGTPVGAASSAVTISDATGVQLGNYINASESYFAPGLSAFYKYYYTTSTVSTAGNGCTAHTSGGWIKFTYYTCTTSSSSGSGTVTSVQASAVDLAAKRLELIGYINSSTAGAIYQSSAYSYIIRTVSGATITIDSRYPLQANPVQVQQANGQVTTYSGAYTY